MPSLSYSALVLAVSEINELTSAHPTAGAIIPTALSRVLGRASVVLLSSHFERYFYAINEEAVTFLNSCGLTGERVPETLRLVHSKQPISEIEQTSWENRSRSLAEFISTDAWLWGTGVTGSLEHQRILAWMKAPKPESLVRFYRYWGIQDIFAAITRRPTTRGSLRLLVQELVDKRNNIAHGDFSAQATRSDVRRYSHTVLTFCERADRVFARELRRLSGTTVPW